MAPEPKVAIGAEVHTLGQFFRVEEGTGEAVHHTRADAEADTEHFDGRTTDS